MASKLEYLLEILERNQYRHLKHSAPVLKEESFLKSEFFYEAREIFSSLGGVASDLPYHPAEWDLEFENFVVKLDEEKSFNRYRANTLRSSFYSNVHFFNLENYKRYCRQFEGECLKAARSRNFWSDTESEMFFGRSEEPGELSLKGSSKWKMRAFADYLEDIQSKISKINLIRVCIYDNLMINSKLIKLDQLLMSRNPGNEKYILNYLLRRIPT
jgi:hypothetical protein